MALGRVLMFFGVLLTVAGVLVWYGVPIGRLPGDILVKRGNVSFYVPVTTSVIVSVVMTALVAWFRR
ncbi:MAG: DUF2905 domain-containing protein [Acidobacteriota bacterium]